MKIGRKSNVPVKLVTRSCSISDKPMPAFHFLIMTTLAPLTMEKRPTGMRAVMWNKGTAIRLQGGSTVLGMA